MNAERMPAEPPQPDSGHNGLRRVFWMTHLGHALGASGCGGLPVGETA